LFAQPGSALAQAAEAHAATPAQVALAWLLSRFSVCVPLPGTVDPFRLAEDLAALELELTAVEVDRLSAAR
jgi:aryl-alcohol dehydrogenase-like predicted oxidoreductase